MMLEPSYEINLSSCRERITLYQAIKKALIHYSLGLFQSYKTIRVYMTLNLGRHIQTRTGDLYDVNVAL